jgi:chemotaxis-related protein WspB
MLLLIFYVGTERYGIDSRKIVEVIPLVTFKTVPHAPPYVAGLFNYRGSIVPVVDLTALIAAMPARPLLSTRIILVEYTAENGRRNTLGLLAERVTETVSCREEEFIPPGIVTGEGPYLGDILKDEEGMIQRIEVHAILPEELRQALFASVEKDLDDLSGH